MASLLILASVLSGSACPGQKASAPKDGPQIAGLEEIRKEVLTPGPADALAAAEGDIVYVLYEGSLPTGSVFDSNIDNPDNRNVFSFVVGTGGVIKGWDQGIVGVKKGEKVKLEIPSDLAYGEAGSPPNIPANADLIFEIEVVDLIKKGEEDIYDLKEVRAGSGAAVKEGDTVTIDYEVRLLNGDLVDSSLKRGKTETYKIGARDVISGFDLTLVGLKAGGHYQLRLPPALAYNQGRDAIPANQIVLADVYIRAVNGQKG